MRVFLYYNSKSGNGRGKADAEGAKAFFEGDEIVFKDLLEVTGEEIVKSEGADRVVICGGDGTLNHFINDIDGNNVDRDIYFYATGSGNDFLNDLEKKKEDGPVLINEYIKDLPTVKVKGMERKFINGIGYGIDGYCCEEGDRIRATSDKPVNYTSIAIKGLLFHYKPTNAIVTVDGVRKEYKKVWLSPAMNGRYIGGGMMITPNQKRISSDKKLSNLVFHNAGKIKALMIFPSIFKGEHVKYTKNTVVTEGRHIKVQFDRPVALQIDGETILNVTEYEVNA